MVYELSVSLGKLLRKSSVVTPGTIRLRMGFAASRNKKSE